MKNKLINNINKIVNIIMKIIGVLIYIETICVIIGIADIQKIGAITSYIICGTIALFGEWKINTKINAKEESGDN